jgi:hypothetical protein
MLIHELDNFYPKNFKPLSTIFLHTLWEEKKIQSTLSSVFPKLLNLSELDNLVDNASSQKVIEYRKQICDFLHHLIKITDIYYQYNFSNNIKPLNKDSINLRFCIRFFERCGANILIPASSLAFRGGVMISVLIFYTLIAFH